MQTQAAHSTARGYTTVTLKRQQRWCIILYSVTCTCSGEEEPEREQLREVGGAHASDGVPARLRDEPFRATTGVRAVCDVVERVLERARVDL